MKREMLGPGTGPRPREWWRDVPEFDGEYQASTEGRIRRKVPGGRWAVIDPNTNDGGRKAYYTIWMKSRDGWREYSLLRMIAVTWYPGQIGPGVDVMHRNGLHSDNSAWNIAIVTRAERMRRQCAGHTRRAVYRVDQEGRVVDVYPSIDAAARAAGCCHATVRRYCNGTGLGWLSDGTSFRWAEERKKGGRPRRGKSQGWADGELPTL